MRNDKELDEICGNCGFTYGSHHGGTSPYPYNYCPGHENRMDWENGPGTVFKSTGEYKDEKYNCPIHGLQDGPDCPKC